MTKKISFLIAVICSAVALSGCSAIDFGKIGAGENDPATEGEKAVAQFHDNIRSGTLGELEDYFIPSDNTEKLFAKYTDINILKSDLDDRLGDVSRYISEETAEKWLGKFTVGYYGASDYTIDDVTVNGEDVNVTVTMQVPDFDMIPEISRDDVNAVMEESFDFDVNDTKLLFEELALRKGVNETELRGIYSKSDSNVWITDIFELFSDEFDTAFNCLTNKMFTDCPTEEYKLYYTVKKQDDDTWKITDVNSD